MEEDNKNKGSIIVLEHWMTTSVQI